MKISAITSLLIAAALAGPPDTAQAGGNVAFLNSGKVLPKGLPFSEIVRHGDTLYLSGLIGTLPGTTKLAPGGIREEARQTMDNVKATLEANGYSMKHLVKCIVMLEDMKEWAAFNEVYKTYFSGHYPARSAFGADGLAFDARLELTCIGSASAS